MQMQHKVPGKTRLERERVQILVQVVRTCVRERVREQEQSRAY